MGPFIRCAKNKCKAGFKMTGPKHGKQEETKQKPPHPPVKDKLQHSAEKITFTDRFSSRYPGRNNKISITYQQTTKQ